MPITGENDDDWAELARELSRDKPTTPAEPLAPAEEMGLFSEEVEESVTTEYEGEESPESAGESEGEGPPDGQPGTGRKRRRRRRRRRRGGAEQPADGTVGDGPEGEDSEAAEVSSSKEELDTAESGFSDEEESDSDLVPVGGESEEDAGEELLRDLIANWNVPSWDDVVGGLYRPER